MNVEISGLLGYSTPEPIIKADRMAEEKGIEENKSKEKGNVSKEGMHVTKQ